ncbi:histidine phosphatase family protein [Halobacillus litoralis]|uniref:Histidine phosphatase family protein n=1 Tax=Halobacillus litoralis TaxID=45668 RepID=A0A845E4R9_9BACI|nr:histidine phosphatase family protein [Halobacillus litoralis]MYL50784.1 histidine phosphatase family protein [Halobacillus litoralis]
MDEFLLGKLQKGGYTLYVRHGDATVGADQPDFSFDDCSTQRNLSEKGRRQAERYGNAIRRLNIPFATPVFTSPFCRAKESAMLAFGAEIMHIDTFWSNVYQLNTPLSPYEQSAILTRLSSFLEQPPAEGANQFIIAHSFPRDVAFGAIPSMGTIVVNPHGKNHGFSVASHFTLEELEEFVKA